MGGIDEKEQVATLDQKSTAFWNVNVPPALWTNDCPEFLQYALTNTKDQGILGTPDSEYRRQTWQDVQTFIRENGIDRFQRVPSDLRRYREYTAKLVREHGSVMQFVMDERLKWTSLQPRSPPFEDPDDYKILWNDWPYGVDERIVHIVVWTKFELPSDPESELGDLTPEVRQLIDRFVDEVFVTKCGKTNTIWFKNWSSLKSIHAVEHFHVMLFDPDPDFVRTITSGDVPLAAKVGKPSQA